MFCQAVRPSCQNCQSAWSEGRGIWHCGAAVDDGDLQNEATNPEWAIRKHSYKNLLSVLNGKGDLDHTDCENLIGSFGRNCQLFRPRAT